MDGGNSREKKKKKKQDDKTSKKTTGNDERKKPAKTKKKKKTTKEKDETRDRSKHLRDGDGAISSSSKAPRRATSFSTSSSFHSFESKTTTSSDNASFESSSSEDESSNMISRQIETYNGNFSSISQSPSTSSAAVAVSKEKQQQPSSTTKSSTTITPRVKTKPTPSFLLNRTGSLPIEAESIEEDSSTSKRKSIRRKQRTIQRSKSADFDVLLEDTMTSSPSHSDSVNNRSSKTNTICPRRDFSTPKRSKSGDFDILDDNKSSNNNKTLSKSLHSGNLDKKRKPSCLSTNKKKKPPTDGAFIVTRANRRIVSLDVDPNDPNWRWKVFPEPTSIEYLTTEIDDEIADEVYSSRHYIRKPPTKPRRPGISGYDFDTILAEENENEPQTPATLGGGVFGDYLAERQKMARWQARLASREKMSIRIQTLVRRFLARLEYLERVRLKGLEQKKQRIRELGRLVDQINESRIAALRNLNVEFEKRRVKERESFFENFKLRGRKEMLETRKMVAMKPQLHRQSKALKSERHEMKTRIEKISVQNKKLKTKNDKLQIESDQLEKLVHQQSKLLAETNHLCSIESTLRAVYENGLNRTLSQIRKATPDDVDLLDSIDDMAKFCKKTIEQPQRTNEPCPLAT